MSTITQIPLEAIAKGKKIGSGAHSDAFLGNWNGKPVAIKVLRSLKGTSQEALEKEASLLSALKHPNIVEFHGLINKTHHFVFDFIANGSLHSLIMDKSTATWKIGQRLSICKDMTKGLSYLHSQNIIHRNFKSPNVLIDEHLRAKIVHKQTTTQTGRIDSKAGMAPKQFESGHYKASVDIYALGLVIWEVFEEKQPFAGSSTNPKIRMEKAMPKKGEELSDKTPESLHGLLNSCWEKASKRPTAEEVLEWLENAPIGVGNKQALIEEVQKGDLETLKKLIALEEAAGEPVAAPVSVNFTVPEIAFGMKDWNTYFGDVGKEPPLPFNIGEILQSPCPFWPEQKVAETHFLCLMPKTVNGKPLTLDSLQKLVKKPKQGEPTKYRYYWPEIQKGYGSKPVENSYWVLMTKNVIPGSRKLSYEDQKALVQKVVPYKMPKLIEAAGVIFMHIFKTGGYIYTDNNLGKKWTYTRCLEKNPKYQWPLAIGGLSEAGLYVHNFGHSDYDTDGNGVGGSRKFHYVY